MFKTKFDAIPSFLSFMLTNHAINKYNQNLYQYYLFSTNKKNPLTICFYFKHSNFLKIWHKNCI
ncbi:hypothetical protein D0466_02300 [Peribacillus glennii]|uniref:Uncharacterized protein n=1 Tax=Peribacillus glennii TaxID=2303991 RepID=A0A372LEW3_9BACI|nr:hypothetical protein D0466_02300 [Peribacillus glennii]